MLWTQVAANRDREVDAVNDLPADAPWFVAGGGQTVRVESLADVRTLTEQIMTAAVGQGKPN